MHGGLKGPSFYRYSPIPNIASCSTGDSEVEVRIKRYTVVQPGSRLEA